MFGKIGGAFKWFGKGTLWLFKRPEMRLIASFNPIPGLNTAVRVIGAFDNEDKTGEQKMLAMIAILRQDPMYKNKKESELRWIVETALQVVEGRIKFNGLKAKT